jgi:AraC-like DNA-binding protein
MAELDIMLRYSAFGLLLWLAVLCVRDYRHTMTGKLGAWAAVCTAAYMHTIKAGTMVGSVDLAPVLLPLDSAGPVFVWLFCLSQFDDHFRFTWVHKTVGVVKVISGVGAFYSSPPGASMLETPFFFLTLVIGIGIMAHLGIVAWRGRHDDLLEDRCRFRTLVSASMVVVSVGILIGVPMAIALGIEAYLMPVQALAVLGVTLFLLWQISSECGTELFVFTANGGRPDEPAIGPDDVADIRALQGMIAGHAYLEPGLTIAALADKLNMPEHRLRRLINQHLGFRNFSDFLNHHRITAAQARLADTEARHVPVLTIAMDLGYGSLGPFNRAFKERTGLTPSEYRRQVLSNAA